MTSYVSGGMLHSTYSLDSQFQLSKHITVRLTMQDAKVCRKRSLTYIPSCCKHANINTTMCILVSNSTALYSQKLHSAFALKLHMVNSLWLSPVNYAMNKYIFTGRICPKGSSAGIVFTHGPIFGFSPHSCTDQGEIWQGGADKGPERRSAPSCQISP